MNEPIENNLIVNWMISFAHGGIICKISLRTNCLTFKNRIIGTDTNLYLPGFNGFRLAEIGGIEGHTFGVFNRRRELRRLKDDNLELTGEEEEDLQYFAPVSIDNDSVASDYGWDERDDLDGVEAEGPPLEIKCQIDHKFLLGMISCLSHSTPGDKTSHEEALRMALHYMEHSRNGKKMKPKAISRRFTTFCRSGWVTGDTLADFIALYKSTRANGGNTICHHSAKREDVVNVTTLLDARTDGSWFYVPVAGVAKPGKFRKSTHHDGGETYDPYSYHGREIIYTEYEYSNGAPGEGRRRREKGTHRGTFFDVRQFVPITFAGLRNRTQGNVKAHDLSEYSIVVDPTVCKATGGERVEDPNNLYVLRVKLVKKDEDKKRKAKEEGGGKKKKKGGAKQKKLLFK